MVGSAPTFQAPLLLLRRLAEESSHSSSSSNNNSLVRLRLVPLHHSPHLLLPMSLPALLFPFQHSAIHLGGLPFPIRRRTRHLPMHQSSVLELLLTKCFFPLLVQTKDTTGLSSLGLVPRAAWRPAPGPRSPLPREWATRRRAEAALAPCRAIPAAFLAVPAEASVTVVA